MHKHKKMLDRWARQRRKMIEFADDLEIAQLLDPLIGGSPAVYRKIAEEFAVRIKHVRAGFPPPLPDAPWTESLIADSDMEFTFQVAEWNKLQAGNA